VGGRQKCRTNNIKEYYKDNIYIADKSANDNLSENKPNIKIQDEKKHNQHITKGQYKAKRPS
jgi:hypothetical protein